LLLLCRHLGGPNLVLAKDESGGMEALLLAVNGTK
jgi:hypothetical protein